MTHSGLLRTASGLVLIGLAVLVVAIPSNAAMARSGDGLVPVPSFEPAERRAECAAEPPETPREFSAAFTVMASGAGQAVACAAMLEAVTPGWERQEGAERLIGPFIDHLLGDGTARGLQRHQVFIDLLGHLEKIEPGWRFHPAARARMPEIILASVVEDPFVADFWSTALREMDPEWRQSDTAKSLLPEIYARALEEATKTSGPYNARPASLLKALSVPRYAWLKIHAVALESWPKRIVSALLVLLLVVTALVLRRRGAS